jgi:hypothetical protein
MLHVITERRHHAIDEIQMDSGAQIARRMIGLKKLQFSNDGVQIRPVNEGLPAQVLEAIQNIPGAILTVLGRVQTRAYRIVKVLDEGLHRC